MNNAFQDYSLVTTGEIALLPGVYFGLLQQTKSFGGMTQFLRPEKYVWLKALGRAIVTIAILIGPFLMLALITTKQI